MCGGKFLNCLWHYWYVLHKILCMIEINKCLVGKILLTNVTKTNEHLNVTRLVHALLQSQSTIVSCAAFLVSYAYIYYTYLVCIVFYTYTVPVSTCTELICLVILPSVLPRLLPLCGKDMSKSRLVLV